MKPTMRVVILAGGRGRRLAPYTTVIPKPLMPVGDMPILEVILRQLKVAGFYHVTLAVGHLAELLRAFFNNGDHLGLRIDYAFEKNPLGTVGPLSQIEDLHDTFLLMNGDILTTLDFHSLIRFHRKQKAVATIATQLREVKIDFGVIETNSRSRLTDYIEKPDLQYKVSMGVYVLEPLVLRYLKKGQPLDIPDLIKQLLDDGGKVVGYPFKGYWLDIGRHDDYIRALDEFEAKREQFIPKSKNT